ncbi:MAG TPA: hypothetical protein DIT28_11845 [Oxalobacteraceae bacterium]|nr:hypothetical protein [Oxalobacteraceae bacterium]
MAAEMEAIVMTAATGMTAATMTTGMTTAATRMAKTIKATEAATNTGVATTAIRPSLKRSGHAGELWNLDSHAPRSEG